jgi:hypothetical protein
MWLGDYAKSKPNFVIGLGVTITILLGSTLPKHLNIQILHVSLLVINLIGFEISNATQKFLKK